MCLGLAAVPATESARRYARVIRGLLVVQALVVVLNFVAATAFLREAVFGIFFFFLLYVVQHQLSHQAVMLFIFISIFFAVDFMVYFLTPIQNQLAFATFSGMELFCYAVSVFSFLYYAFCAVFCFYPYREFKTIEFNANPALRNYFKGGDAADVPSEPPSLNKNIETVNYEVNYGNIAFDQNKKNNDHGTFEVFKGQGVKIG